MLTIYRSYSESRQKGNLGEDIACLFLMKQGFRIVGRNYLKPWGEIDIIAEKGGIVRFVEVKSVSCETNHDVARETVTYETIKPEENMTEGKMNRLKKAIKTYMIEKKISHETPFQMDLITVRIDQTSKTAIVEKFDNVGQ